ncbi:hypothetical protein [Clostridium merdae]|uniref:hypothetical protein n=1 Tax=Clostridium merdae TaxID=1958780 RepID=UPI0013563F87|nr:hypothetical protein [Clostridium merdae]
MSSLQGYLSEWEDTLQMGCIRTVRTSILPRRLGRYPVSGGLARIPPIPKKTST